MKKTTIFLLMTLFFLTSSTLYPQEKDAKQTKILNSSVKYKNLQNSDTLCPGSVFTIEWEGVDPGDTVKIEYSTNGGTDWLLIEEKATGLSYDWTVPNTPSKNCRARVSIEVDDVKNITVTYPNGGETFEFNEEVEITWTSSGIDSIKIQFSKDDGDTWALVQNAVDANTGTYKWLAANYPSDSCLIKITDIQDENTYDQSDAFFEIIIAHADTVKICDQVWATRNLDVTHYRNGDPITHAQTAQEWQDAADNDEGAWCYYDNDPANGEIYGKLYNWYAVNDPRGLAPEGWHVPSDDEWQELVDCLGGENVAGGKLKSTGTIDSFNGLWGNPNTGATNQNHFSALPGGNRIFNGDFSGLIGDTGFWWSSTENLEKFALYRHIEDNRATIGRDLFAKELGLSVRLVRD